jgi:hypothetical protein
LHLTVNEHAVVSTGAASAGCAASSSVTWVSSDASREHSAASRVVVEFDVEALGPPNGPFDVETTFVHAPRSAVVDRDMEPRPGWLREHA